MQAKIAESHGCCAHGCQWRAIPKHLPPRGTHFDDLALGAYDGTLDRIHPALYEEGRERSEREASPTGDIIDSHRPHADFACP
ncbi:MAG: hypothetical protein WAM29_11080 [Methylocella sp.]